ncbi:MAG TPA: GMP/IMP nucleotidase [Gammaproteobacteria bacterium]|nr:GMP/IMP nucleotidase [Gammaproteobacteria bacterium]
MRLTAAASVEWDRIDTVLVDMDGTLLDLAFDNFFWLELLPEHYAEVHACSVDDARTALAARFDAIAGTLNWYCLDHWTRDLKLDIRSLKRRSAHLVRYLPGAREFLVSVRERGKHLWIVTNAHRDTFAVKAEQTGIDRLVDRVVSSHDFRAPKESTEFWRGLERRHPFDRRRTLLIEDSLAVLEAAVGYGVAHTIAIRRPDSRRPPRAIDAFAAVDGVADLL